MRSRGRKIRLVASSKARFIPFRSPLFEDTCALYVPAVEHIIYGTGLLGLRQQDFEAQITSLIEAER